MNIRKEQLDEAIFGKNIHQELEETPIEKLAFRSFIFMVSSSTSRLYLAKYAELVQVDDADKLIKPWCMVIHESSGERFALPLDVVQVCILSGIKVLPDNTSPLEDGIITICLNTVDEVAGLPLDKEQILESLQELYSYIDRKGIYKYKTQDGKPYISFDETKGELYIPMIYSLSSFPYARESIVERDFSDQFDFLLEWPDIKAPNDKLEELRVAINNSDDVTGKQTILFDFILEKMKESWLPPSLVQYTGSSVDIIRNLNDMAIRGDEPFDIIEDLKGRIAAENTSHLESKLGTLKRAFSYHPDGCFVKDLKGVTSNKPDHIRSLLYRYPDIVEEIVEGANDSEMQRQVWELAIEKNVLNVYKHSTQDIANMLDVEGISKERVQSILSSWRSKILKRRKKKS